MTTTNRNASASFGGSDEVALAYWSAQMDAAYDFMQRIIRFPVAECGEKFAHLPDAVRDAGVEARFSDTPVIEDVSRLFYLREGLTPDFIAVCRDMNDRGWVLKVEDGYRTLAIQKGLAKKPNVFDQVLRAVMWECGGKKPDPAFMAKRVAAMIAYCPKVGTHMSASAIDISVFDRTTGAEIDRGRPYLEMSVKTPIDSPFVSDEARRNRAQITAMMKRRGFITYPWEFWHYNKDDAYAGLLTDDTKPARYGAVHWDPRSNSVTPIENPTKPLNSPEEIEAAIKSAINRVAS